MKTLLLGSKRNSSGMGILSSTLTLRYPYNDIYQILRNAKVPISPDIDMYGVPTALVGINQDFYIVSLRLYVHIVANKIADVPDEVMDGLLNQSYKCTTDLLDIVVKADVPIDKFLEILKEPVPDKTKTADAFFNYVKSQPEDGIDFSCDLCAPVPKLNIWKWRHPFLPITGNINPDMMQNLTCQCMGWKNEEYDQFINTLSSLFTMKDGKRLLCLENGSMKNTNVRCVVRGCPSLTGSGTYLDCDHRNLKYRVISIESSLRVDIISEILESDRMSNCIMTYLSLTFQNIDFHRPKPYTESSGSMREKRRGSRPEKVLMTIVDGIEFNLISRFSPARGRPVSEKDSSSSTWVGTAPCVDSEDTINELENIKKRESTSTAISSASHQSPGPVRPKSPAEALKRVIQNSSPVRQFNPFPGVPMYTEEATPPNRPKSPRQRGKSPGPLRLKVAGRDSEMVSSPLSYSQPMMLPIVERSSTRSGVNLYETATNIPEKKIIVVRPGAAPLSQTPEVKVKPTPPPKPLTLPYQNSPTVVDAQAPKSGRIVGPAVIPVIQSPKGTRSTGPPVTPRIKNEIPDIMLPPSTESPVQRPKSPGPPKPEKRKAIPQALRMRVWAKETDKIIGNCWVCRAEIRIEGWHCSHRIAVANGGTDTYENLYPCCQSCNLSMGSQDMDAFIFTYYPQRYIELINKW